MTQDIRQSNDDQPFSHLEDDLILSEQLEAKVTVARQTMERAVGCQLEIDRFEPIEVAGEWLLRVFWRKVITSEQARIALFT
jgi:hypothetical protein